MRASALSVCSSVSSHSQMRFQIIAWASFLPHLTARLRLGHPQIRSGYSFSLLSFPFPFSPFLFPSFLSFSLFSFPFPPYLPLLVYRIKEVQFAGGVASASSYHHVNWRPEKAFKRQTAVDNGWHGGPASNPAHSLPLTVWYDFKSRSVRPAEVGVL